MKGNTMNNEIIKTETHQWAQLKGENSKQFLAFNQYLELGSKRSFTKIAAFCNLSPSCIRKWADKWEWEARAAAHDRHIIRIQDRKKQEKFEQMEKLQSDKIINMSLLVYELIDFVNKKTKTELENLSNLEYTEMLKTIKLWIEVVPPLSDFASAMLDINKSSFIQNENPMHLMNIYDKHPELLDDVYNLIEKIQDAPDDEDKNNL
jgi:hypothetical protein